MLFKCLHQMNKHEYFFIRLYSAFMELFNVREGTSCPQPGFSDNQMFFKDFLETMSCPAFNEHLRNLLVARILELNASSFDADRNLHSAVTVDDSRTPLRTEKFTETVMSLCIYGKVLGYLTFSPYRYSHKTINCLLVTVTYWSRILFDISGYLCHLVHSLLHRSS